MDSIRILVFLLPDWDFRPNLRPIGGKQEETVRVGAE
jgi:hypothetical protein